MTDLHSFISKSAARLLRARWVVAGAIVIVAAAVWLLTRGHDTPNGSALTYTARRGPLEILVTESGGLEAVESQEVRSEVKGWEGRKILSIVEEGYLITDDDVKTNKVLVELDSSEIRQRIVTQEIEFESKQAALTEAQQGYAIQINQNVTDLKAGEQKARFARLEAEKYLGARVAGELVRKLKLDEIEAELLRDDGLAPEMPSPGAASLTNGVAAGFVPSPGPTGGSSPAVAGGSATPGAHGPASGSPAAATAVSVEMVSLPKVQLKGAVDYATYARVELLEDGEAQQKLREAKDTLLIAEKERAVSQTKFEGTQRLHDKGFVTKSELDSARLELEQVGLKVQKGSTALTLLTRYEFAKQAEELLGKYEEALRGLSRTRREGMSKLAQARAKLKAAESQFSVVRKERDDLQEQLLKCTIRSTKPGLVTYGGQRDGFYYGEERIRVGATIRERQPIITIPDLTKMAVVVKVHEAQVKRVKKEMQARIRVDAFPDKELTGAVVKVGVLPDADNRWMNPDLKVYSTKVHIEGVHDWLKPGMTAKVEIQVDRLDDVILVPIQAVAPGEKEQACTVVKNGREERRVVHIGEYNDEFVQVKDGLEVGEVVLLRRPDSPSGNGKEAAPAEAKPALSPAQGAVAPTTTAAVK